LVKIPDLFSGVEVGICRSAQLDQEFPPKIGILVKIPDIISGLELVYAARLKSSMQFSPKLEFW
jgi:hypothetical protein